MPTAELYDLKVQGDRRASREVGGHEIINWPHKKSMDFTRGELIPISEVIGPYF